MAKNISVSDDLHGMLTELKGTDSYGKYIEYLLNEKMNKKNTIEKLEERVAVLEKFVG